MMARIHFRVFIFYLIAATLLVVPQLALAHNIAIVVGNTEYSYLSRLPNASRDAQAIGGALSDLGYEVFKGIDVSLQQTKRLLVDATSSEQPIETVLFFYAGHGVQMGGSNYFLASNADGTDKRSLRQGAIDASDVVNELSLHAKSVVIIVDACRNNPFAEGTFGDTASASASGLADIALPPGSYIAFSTQPGRVALDGGGRNSPFTEAILRHIRAPGASIQDVMLRVRKDVSDITDGVQIPFERSALLQRVVFSPSEQIPDVVPPVSEPAQQPVPKTDYSVTHQVYGLNPYGDGFLSLRAAPSSQSSELRKLIEGTKLTLLERKAPWMHVRLLDGQEGWVHSNWVAAYEAQEPRITQAAPTNASSIESMTCDQLWFARNQVFHDHGYCFSSARGMAAFSNASCDPKITGSDIPLTSIERDLVFRIQARERQLGC